MNNRRLIFFIILAVFAGVGLAIINRGRKVQRVEAAGNLLITYLDVPLSGPIFNLTDMKPGDCDLRTVKVKNNGTHEEDIRVRGNKTGGVGNDPLLESILDFIISEKGSDLYGGTKGAKTLAQFFTDSTSGLELGKLGKNNETSFIFKVCFPFSAGNEYQKKSVVFDLIFGTNGETVKDHIVINEVYYDVDPTHGVDSPGDRGVVVGGHSVRVEQNGEGSENSAFVDIENLCQAIQGTTTDVLAALKLLGNTGNNQSISSINARKVLNAVIVEVNGGSNTLNNFCGGQSGRNHEWIELYNPTDHTVNLKNWTITDNSGISVKINGNHNLGSHKFALISKSNSTWTFWSEPAGTMKISLGRQIGDGLDDSGDHLILKNSNDQIIDAMSYGNDTTEFSLAGVEPGHSLEREPDGLDTDFSSDWTNRFPPMPGS